MATSNHRLSARSRASTRHRRRSESARQALWATVIATLLVCVPVGSSLALGSSRSPSGSSCTDTRSAQQQAAARLSSRDHCPGQWPTGHHWPRATVTVTVTATATVTVTADPNDPTAGPPTDTPTTDDPTVTPTTDDPTVTPTTDDPTVTPTTTSPTVTATVTPTVTPPTYTPTTSTPTVTPTVTPPTVTPTVTPPTVTPTTSTPTVTPTTPTSTPTVTPTPVPGDWPGPGNTGVPAGTNLRLLKNGDSGSGWHVDGGVLYITQSGATLDSMDIPFEVKVTANNVSITRSRIRASGYYTINVSDPPTYYTGLRLTDVEIDGLNDTRDPGIAVMANRNAVYTRLNVHGFGSSGPRIDSGTTMQDSWIHDFVCPSGSGWHSAGSSANSGGGGISILHNRIDINTSAAGCASAAFALYPADGGPFDGVDIIGNYFDGGAYGLYTGQNQPGVRNVHVEGNRFGRKYYPSCGQYGPVAQASTGNGNTFSGNAYIDGTPING